MYKNNVRRTLGKAFVVGAVFALMAGCQKQEGPAEHAGKELDKAAAQAGRQVEKAGDSIQDAAKGDKK